MATPQTRILVAVFIAALAVYLAVAGLHEPAATEMFCALTSVLELVVRWHFPERRQLRRVRRPRHARTR